MNEDNGGNTSSGTMMSNLPKNVYLFLKNLKNWQQFLLGLILTCTLTYYVGKESIDRYIDNEAEIKLQEIKLEEINLIKEDSLNFKKAQVFWEKSIEDELALRDICDDMEKYFEGETQISLLKLHDHGDVLAPENNPRVTIKWSTLLEIQDSYQNEPVYTGALWAMNQADTKGFIYIPNVSEEENYWIGREKAFHESIKSKSAAFIHVKDTRKEGVLVSKWFIAIHWKIESPYKDPYLLRIKLERFSNLIKDKIYIAPKNLRVN